MSTMRRALCVFLALAAPCWAGAQERDTAGHGPNDRAGASRLMSEAKAIEAANIIRRGRVVEIGRDYRADMPMRPGQEFRLHTTREDTGAVLRIDTVPEGPLPAIGTRLDGLGHIGAVAENGGPARFYNGHSEAEVAPGPGDGPGALGIEHVKPFFTRGLLIDMVTVRGGPMQAGDEITVADIETALDWFDLEPPGRGDAVILHTGWGRHWIADNATYLSGAPGIGIEAAHWLAERGVALVGADTWSVEVQPVRHGDGPVTLPVHRALIAGHGIFLHENLETERLIDAEIAEFAYIFTPLPVVGATGSPGAPLAVY